MSTREFDAAPAAAAIATDRLALRPIGPLPGAIRPRSTADGYRVQFALHDEMLRRGRGRRVGWKIGATTRLMQEWVAVDRPCGGGVLADAVRLGEGTFPAAGYVKPMVETEIVATLGADLPGRDRPHDRDSVADAVATLHAGIELVDDRYADFRTLGAPTLIGDDFFQAGVVIGPGLANWRSIDPAELTGRVTIGDRIAGEGMGSAVMDHPLNALAWLADTLAAHGTMLRAGEFVFLGSVVAPQPVAAGDTAVVAFHGLGAAKARFE
ncbi:MAG: 2-keto-4-pentenoate hydratase [Alphaproteobacteria bacterium]